MTTDVSTTASTAALPLSDRSREWTVNLTPEIPERARL